jgi:hypothetical protein
MPGKVQELRTVPQQGARQVLAARRHRGEKLEAMPVLGRLQLGADLALLPAQPQARPVRGVGGDEQDRNLGGRFCFGHALSSAAVRHWRGRIV